MLPLTKNQKRIVFCWIILTALLFACIFIIDFFQLTQWRPFGSHLVEIYGSCRLWAPLALCWNIIKIKDNDNGAIAPLSELDGEILPHHNSRQRETP